MAETSWETHARRRTRLWKWSLIILLVVLVAGIIIYNNRDVISGKTVLEAEPGEHVQESSDTVVKAVPDLPHKKAVSGIPADTVQSKTGKQKHLERPQPVVPVNSVQAARPRLPTGKPATKAVVSSVDSVEVGEVPCVVSNRPDVVVRIAVVVYCDKAMKPEVLFKRDALAVVIRNTIRPWDLESIRFDVLKPGLLKAMNLVFDTRTITDIALRSVKIEKASFE